MNWPRVLSALAILAVLSFFAGAQVLKATDCDKAQRTISDILACSMYVNCQLTKDELAEYRRLLVWHSDNCLRT